MGGLLNFFAPLQVSWSQSADLLVPWRHDRFVNRQRAALTISRVQIISVIFAVLVPLWIPIDAAVFEPDVWMKIVPIRIGAALVFVALAWPRQIRTPAYWAPVMLAVMLLVPPLFHLAAQPILAAVPATGIAAIVKEVYGYLPFAVVAGLSIFPLTALEVGGCTLVVLGMMLGGAASQAGFHWQTLAGPVWLLLLMSGAALISGMSQLQYMMALVRRVSFDALTGALTRRTGIDLLESQFRISVMQQRPYCVAFVDLDHFKEINDMFGHDNGDAALQAAAEHLVAGLRKGDALVRWGGEEFVLLLPGADKEGAKLVIDRIAERGLGRRADGKAITASIGIAERAADSIHDWAELVDLADARMYEAKIGGRNAAVFGPDDARRAIVALGDVAR